MIFEKTAEKVKKSVQNAGRACLNLIIAFFLWAGGITAFLIICHMINVPWYLTLLIGIVSAFIIIMIFKIKNKIKKGRDGRQSVKGTVLTSSEFAKLIQEGRQKILKIKNLQNKITDINVKNKIREISEITKKIYDNLESDPKNLQSARQFINYYFDASVKVIDKYSELSGHKDISSSVDQSLKNVESSLEVIIKAFKLQLKKQLEDNAVNIDVELKVLNDTLRSEGIK